MVEAIADHRKPGQPMRHLGLKLPEAAYCELEAIAGELQVHRSQLARHLLMRSLQEARAARTEA
jgi:hypothetical protein